jgi:hypothetical protein
MATPIIRQTSGPDWHPESGSAGAVGLECPDCHSTALVKLSLVHATGISILTGAARGRGLLVGENGASVSYARLRASGTLQTQLSRTASPPRKKRYRYVLTGWILGLYLALLIAASMQSGPPGHVIHIHHAFTLFVWLYSAVLIVVLAVLWHHNHALYAQRYRDWDRSFMCRRCGTIVRVNLHD